MDRFARRLQKLINSGKEKHATGNGRTTRFKAQVARGCQKLEVLVRKALPSEKPDKQQGVEHKETNYDEPVDGVYTPACFVDKEVTIKQPSAIDKASSQANNIALAPTSNADKLTHRASLPSIQITPPTDEAVINDGGYRHNNVEDAPSFLPVEGSLENTDSALKNTTVVQIQQEDLSAQHTDKPTTSVITTDATSICAEGDRFHGIQGRDADSNRIHSMSPSEDDPADQRRAEQVEAAGDDGDDGQTSQSTPIAEELFDETASDTTETTVSSTELVNDAESPRDPYYNKGDEAEDRSAPVPGEESAEDEASLSRMQLAAETKLSDGEGLRKGANQVVDHKLVDVGCNVKDNSKQLQRVSEAEVGKRGSENRNVASIRDASVNVATLEDFQPVIEALSLPALTQLALAIRKRYASNANEAKRINWCKVNGNPVFGSFNLVYFLTFNDGAKWVARLPGYGAKPTHLQAEKIESEYNTMRYLRANTTLKMPEVFYWDSSTRSVGAACALMSFVPGQALTKLWPSFNETQRLTTIKTVAAEMAKLYCLQFPQTGMLRFDRCGEIAHVASELGCFGNDFGWEEISERGPFRSTNEWFSDRLKNTSYGPKSLFNRPPFRLPNSVDDTKVVLRSMPGFMRRAPLSLSLSDADYQNIMCDSVSGKVIGFIDLDNVRVAPVTIGSAAYPPILTCDREPRQCMPEQETGDNYNVSAMPVYRKHYAAAFKAALPAGVHYDPRWTELSHHTMMLEVALNFPSLRYEIMGDMAETAYKNVYEGTYSGDLDDLWCADQSRKNPLRRIRFKRTIARGLWQRERQGDVTQ
ncbi:hypothetical protein LTR70_004008 [Exophiala xenobiotica]|uniref:Aminoglycoside phosphotransferase domain-containing protein n=1 Tax=Lithohypha guttulata TaxID=1690604 RepID=A0ABR0KER1_9EURO|nr:hypothetical protein LTR24_003546 [Lithohypha guttulata]KAK5321618.1 hypothetical protein LTR70_004008 [Exophiala xenobiotica]